MKIEKPQSYLLKQKHGEHPVHPNKITSFFIRAFLSAQNVWGEYAQNVWGHKATFRLPYAQNVWGEYAQNVW